VAEFREMVNESPENAAYRFNLGRAYMVSEDMEGARRELAEAVKVQPEFSSRPNAAVQGRLTPGR
jgi:Flp pilus assembly protein TadD